MRGRGVQEIARWIQLGARIRNCCSRGQGSPEPVEGSLHTAFSPTAHISDQPLLSPFPKLRTMIINFH